MEPTTQPEPLNGNGQQDLLLELKRKIAERQELRDTIIQKLEKLISTLGDLCRRTKTASGLGSPAQVARRTELEREIGTFHREIIKEELACWRDVTQLEAQMREVQQEMLLMKNGESRGNH